MKKTATTMLLIILTVSILTAASTITPNTKASPENAKILSYSWYTYPASGYDSGELIVVGEVQNIGTTTLDGVRIEGIPYTTDGQPQADSMCAAFVENMTPQQKAPFYMYFDSYTSFSGNMTWINQIDHIDLAVVYANDTTTQPFPDLTMMANTSYTDPSTGVYTVTGIVKNTGTQPSPNLVWVVTTFYNASGTVVGVNETASPYLKTSLAPNATYSYTATPDDYAQIKSQITSYSVIVQSRQTATATAAPSPSPTQTPAPSPTATPANSQQPTQPQNQGLDISSILIYVLIGAAVAVVAVFAVRLTRKKK